MTYASAFGDDAIEPSSQFLHTIQARSQILDL
jgi:hypothetical protein